MADPCQNLVCLDQLLEQDPPQTLVVVNNNGSPAFFEQGVTGIAMGSTKVVVSFQTQKVNANYTFVELSVENTIDPTPLAITAMITTRTVFGFTASLNGIPDTPNYTLRWTVEVDTL